MLKNTSLCTITTSKVSNNIAQAALYGYENNRAYTESISIGPETDVRRVRLRSNLTDRLYAAAVLQPRPR